jgi:hypothetical protein
MSVNRKFFRRADKDNNSSASAQQAEFHDVSVDSQVEAAADKHGDTNF